MQIRRQDQEIINYMKLLGAGLGVLLSLFVILGLYNDAKERLADQMRSLEDNSPLLAMAGLQLAPKAAGAADEMVVEPLPGGTNKDQTESYQLEKGFFASLTLPGLALICAAAGTAGLIAGYWTVWLLSWIGLFATIKLIRSAYCVIWRFKPDFDGGKSEMLDKNNNVYIERDKNRILPGVLVISVMGLLGLALLALVVYYLAGR